MAIFPVIECDDVIQANDKFRVSASKTYVTKDESAIEEIEIDPGDGVFRSVFEGGVKQWWLDFQHDTTGDKTVAVRVTTDGSPATTTKTVTVLSAAEDKLFSTDQDLVSIESDILKYVPEGRNSFKYKHREAQKEILEWLWTNGFRLYSGQRITKDEVLDLEEVRFWSKYLTFRLIYKDLSNQVDDIFDKKAKRYENDEHKWRQKSVLKLDLNQDGESSVYESFDMTTRNLVRE